MKENTHSLFAASRILYTMLRVTDLERSVAFYRDRLGMQELRRETFSPGRFTLVFMGYKDQIGGALIELTYNWDEHQYERGSAYGHIALEVEDIYGTCQYLEAQGVKITRPPAPMTYAVDETGHREQIAFIADPDEYQIELIQKA